MSELVELALSDIDAGTNVRDHTDDGLRASIQEHGVLQPITVAPSAGHVGRWVVLYGHRRLAGARAAGLPTIPAIVVDQPADLPIRQLVENLDRKGVDPLDVAAAIKAHMEAEGLSQTAIAKKLRRSVTWVNRKLVLLEMPDETRAAVSAGEIGEDDAVKAFRAGQPPNGHGRPRAITTDEDGRSRSVIVPLGEGLASATVGIDLTAKSVDLVVQDSRGRGVLLTLRPDAARLLGRRISQAGQAVTA